MFLLRAASSRSSMSVVRVWRRSAKGSLPQTHIVSRLISAPIEFIFPCRTLAGNPFSESLYLLISSYDRGSACGGRAKLMEVVKTSRLLLVPREGVEPTRPCGQRILSP